MATQLFLTDIKTPPGRFGGGGLHDNPSFWTTVSSDNSYCSGPQLLHTSRGTGVFGSSGTVDTVTGPIDGLVAEGGYLYLSSPIAADFTLSGTLTFNIWASETNVAFNTGLRVRVYKVSALGVSTLVVDSAKGTELPTTAAAQNWTAAPTSTAFAKGDRIAFHVGLDDANGTMTAGTGNIDIRWNGTSGGADGDSYLQLNENITLDETSPSGTIFYLTSTASSVDVGAGTDEKEMWTTQPSSGTTAVRATVAAPIALATEQWTITSGGNAIEWYTRPLTEFTLSGVAEVLLVSIASNAAVQHSMVCEIARVDNSGANASVWARGDLSRVDTPVFSIMGTSRRRFRTQLAGPDLAITNGQRLRFRVYIDDHFSVHATSFPAGHTATIHYNGNTDAPDGSANNCFIRLAGAPTEYSTFLEKKPKRIVGPTLLSNVPGTTLYTVPTAARAWVRHIHIVNGTGSARTVTLSIGPDGATTRVFDNRVLAAGEHLDQRRAAEHWLEAGEVIQANADANNVCSITIDAIEYSQT